MSGFETPDVTSKTPFIGLGACFSRHKGTIREHDAAVAAGELPLSRPDAPFDLL
jgi:hypothetical protein